MLDIRVIRERPDWVKERLTTRGDAACVAQIDETLALDEKRRANLTELETLKARRNSASKEIGGLLKQKQTDQAEAKKAEVREIGDKISELESLLRDIESAQIDMMLGFPNLPHESVAVGNDEYDNPVIRDFGTRPQFDFEAKNHIELCKRLKLVDFERASKITGSGFALYTGAGARLQRSLINFLLNRHIDEAGYTEVSPPFMVNSSCMYGVGQFPKFKDQIYSVQEGEDASTLGSFCLVPTAEAPVANIHREELLSASDLPIRYCAYTPCFRAEAGAAGVGVRGLIRMHQFDKVELIKIVTPESGYDELETMTQDAEAILQALELSYRVILLCTGDMGFQSAKTYDIEVWAPGQNQYLEVSSVSNCEEFQARRMNLRFKDESGKNVFPHMLNGSGVALARLFVALVETHQQADGSVRIPQALQPLFGADRIEEPQHRP